MAYINKYGDKYNSNWYSAGYNYDDIDRKYFNGLNNLNSYTYDEWKTYKKLDNLTYTPEYWEPKIDKKMNKDLKKVVKDNGTVEYYNDNDKLHNLNGPAIEYSNGDKSWYKNGERHRENGPAIEWSNINEYYLNNILYSKDEYYQKVKKTYLNNKQNSKIKSTKPLNVDNGKLTEDEIFLLILLAIKLNIIKLKIFIILIIKKKMII